MNISEAKNQVEKTVEIYLMKDEFGEYVIPVQRQRPIFLLGAPGIGKTAVMEQIAEEMDIALVSYSMTHHTRQSALGLPVIREKTFGGKEYSVSEYTMSEILSSVYETMESSGKKEGILFLDEINCVSETLTPSMLQFLQFKTFGRHRVPKGWVVVTAGNPPQFNKGAREFDVATMDRLKVIEIDASYDAWRKYAVNRGVHGAVISYLDIRKQDFYSLENTTEGMSYVTARGWEDLSEMIKLYEKKGFAADETLVKQYLRNNRVAREFADYYALYRKYKESYPVSDITAGKASSAVIKRAKNADFGERISLLRQIVDYMENEIGDIISTEDSLRIVHGSLKSMAGNSETSTKQLIEEERRKLCGLLETEEQSGTGGSEKRRLYNNAVHMLESYIRQLNEEGIDGDGAWEHVKTSFNTQVKEMQNQCVKIKSQLENAFKFTEKAFGEGNEMLILVTDLTVNDNSLKFINRNGCDPYFKYNKKYQLQERRQAITDEMERLHI
ncbi:MAG: AAA family ATPase [Clostridiales bacterium]|nr:AAA family ATPase [Clostridiales bacterium]